MPRPSNRVERIPVARSAPLGARIRRERTARGLSLAHVASVTGLTKSLLSQVERGVAEPSLASLRKVSLALGVPVSSLFAEAPRPGAVLRRAARKEIRWPALGVSYELVSSDNRKTIQMAVVRLGVGGRSCETLTAGHAAGEECAVVLSGVVEVLVGDVRHVLEEGDSITLDCSVPHQYLNAGTTPATIVAAMSPASF